MKAPSIFQGVSYFLRTLFIANQDKLLYFNTTDTKFLSKEDSIQVMASIRNGWSVNCIKTVNLLRETNNQEAAILDLHPAGGQNGISTWTRNMDLLVQDLL